MDEGRELAVTPIERGARALARRSCPPGGAAQFPYVSAEEWEETNWRDHIPAVRAVLQAIREPSEGMERAAINITGDMAVRKRDGTTYQHTEVFTAMLDAALSE